MPVFDGPSIQGFVSRENMNILMKYKYWIGGAVCLIVLALIIAAIRPKHVSGAPPAALGNVQVALVEQRDVPVYGEWIARSTG
jgi:hypothetical protein